MLQVADVSFAYRAARDDAPAVIQSVSLDVRRGALLGVLGPNGAGKTTLLRLMAGTLTPVSGRILVDAIDVARLPRRTMARKVAVVPQETHATFDFSVLEMVLMGRYPHLGAFELEGASDLAIARDALGAVNAADLESRRFATLSGGEKQRVVIASALAQASEALLLDEPTASLDLAYQLEVVSVLLRLNRERGTTIVVSTHDLNLAAALCTDVALLKGGRLVARGRTESVLTAENVKTLYGVDADVSVHPRAGHLTVVPIARA